MGLDGIGPNVLKYCALALYQPLYRLFRVSILNHSLPTEWKIHGIIPIFKSGDKGSVANYRPISLLSCTSKVLERLVYDRLADYLRKFFSPAQFGFCMNHSAQQQLLLFYHKIFDSRPASSQWDLIFLDFYKAFDSVVHSDLLVKLRKLGVTGDLWLWLRDYLTNRFQCVCIGESRSELLHVKSGVPQGSILGPLLFLVFVNDLSEVVVNSQFAMFADDCKCAKLVSGLQDSNKLKKDLVNLCTWSLQWKLKFKEVKCVHLRCCKSKPIVDTSYSLNNCELSLSDHHKDLGVLISSDLTFSAHYDMIVRKAYRTIGLLRRTFSNRTCVKEKRLLYLTLVRSQLVHCSSVWRPHLLKHIEFLEGVQRRATKYVLNDFKSDYKSRLITLGLLPLMYFLELNDVMFCVRSLKFPTSDFNITDYIQFSKCGTRSSAFMKLSHHFSFRNSERHVFFNRIQRLWNSFPPLDLSKSIVTIKSHLHEFLYGHFLTNFHPDLICTFHFLCPCAKCIHKSHPPILHNTAVLHTVRRYSYLWSL